MNNFDRFINFDEFKQFKLLDTSKSAKVFTSNKIFIPSQKYIFKVFQFKCHSSREQKTILDTFYHISKNKCPYLQSYSHLSFFYGLESQPAFSMKYIQSKPLETLLKTSNLLANLKIEDIFQCLFAVAEGMSYLHDHIIYHGNLCPSNVIVDNANQFYVCDFGLYPIKKLYLKEEDLFNEYYKDPLMKNNEPTFSSDIYSFGVLMCDVYISYLKAMKKINQDETLQNFLNDSDKSKFDSFPQFYSKLISACLNSFLSERPSFNQIIQIFKNEKENVFEIEIQSLYEIFINSNYLLNLAEKNDSNALNKVGKMYEKGKIFEKDDQKALEYYKRAAALNNSDAQNNYGVLMQKKAGKNKSDLIEGAKFLQLSAEQGNIYGMANYAIALLNGCGVEKNFLKAEEYLHKSADFGYSNAQLNYGNLLLENNNSISLINEGLNYIKKAMDQKNADAFYILGSLIQKGKFVVQNSDLAMEYFKIAADMGNKEAALKYADGNMKLKPKNEKIALKYYQIAFENGNKNVKKTIDKLKNKLEEPLESATNKKSELTSSNENKISTKSTKISVRSESSKLFKYYDDSSEYDDTDSEETKQNRSNKKLHKINIKSNKFKTLMPQIDNFPIKISNKMTLISLGTIVYDREKFHSENHIYPVGYQIEREYTSCSDSSQVSLYRCSILDGGEFPIFRVESLENHKIFEGNSSTAPWRKVRKVIEKLKRSRSKNLGVSGLYLYGLMEDIVIYMIERLKNADRCIKYLFKTRSIKKDSQLTKEEEEGNENEEEEANENEEEEANQNEEEEEEEEENQQSSKEIDDSNKSSDDDEEINSLDGMSLQNLIKKGDLLFEKNDLVKALECYKKAVEMGQKDLLLKCAEASQTFDEKLEYLEQAMIENIPKSFQKWRLTIMKRVYLSKNKEYVLNLANRFEKYDDFSDAAILYSKCKNNLKAESCYEKAKLNIDSVKDGYQQYDFALFLINQKDIELAKMMLQKAVSNHVYKASFKLQKITQKTQID